MSVAITLTLSDGLIVGVDSAVTISFGPGQTNIYEDAEKLFHAKNEAAQGPMLNRDLGRVYLSASDPDSTRPTWSAVMEELRSHDRPVSIAQALTHELDYVGVAVRFLRRNHRRSG